MTVTVRPLSPRVLLDMINRTAESYSLEMNRAAVAEIAAECDGLGIIEAAGLIMERLDAMAHPEDY